MNLTTTLLVLLAGIVIGYCLKASTTRLRARYRRATYQPTVLRRLALDLDHDEKK